MILLINIVLVICVISLCMFIYMRPSPFKNDDNDDDNKLLKLVEEEDSDSNTDYYLTEEEEEEADDDEKNDGKNGTIFLPIERRQRHHHQQSQHRRQRNVRKPKYKKIFRGGGGSYTEKMIDKNLNITTIAIEYDSSKDICLDTSKYITENNLNSDLFTEIKFENQSMYVKNFQIIFDYKNMNTLIEVVHLLKNFKLITICLINTKMINDRMFDGIVHTIDNLKHLYDKNFIIILDENKSLFDIAGMYEKQYLDEKSSLNHFQHNVNDKQNYTTIKIDWNLNERVTLNSIIENLKRRPQYITCNNKIKLIADNDEHDDAATNSSCSTRVDIEQTPTTTPQSNKTDELNRSLTLNDVCVDGQLKRQENVKIITDDNTFGFYDHDTNVLVLKNNQPNKLYTKLRNIMFT